MDFQYSKKSLDLQKKLNSFMDKHVYPSESEFLKFYEKNLWEHHPELENWKNKANNWDGSTQTR